MLSYTEVSLRILAAILLGGAVGMGRQFKHRPVTCLSLQFGENRFREK